MYISTENSKVLKTITNVKQRQPLRDKIMLSVPITCSVTECFCPIRHSATPSPPVHIRSSLQGNSNLLHLQRVLQVFLQGHFTNSWRAFKAFSSVVHTSVIHVPSSFHPHLFRLSYRRIFFTGITPYSMRSRGLNKLKMFGDKCDIFICSKCKCKFKC